MRAASGTSSNRSTSTRPAVGQLQARDHRQREERQQLERRLDRAAELARRRRRSRGCARRPRRAARPRAGPRPAAAAPRAPRRRRRRRCPPPMLASRRTANAIDASLVPTTTTLWASWATVEASAPRCRPKPRTKPSPIRPVPRWRSITAILTGRARGRRPPRRRAGSAPRRATRSRSGRGRARSRAPRPPCQGIRNSSGAERADAHRVPHPVGHVGARDLGDRPARLEHDVRDEALQVGEEQQVGLVAGRDRAEVGEPVPERRAERRAARARPPARCRTRPRRAPSS